VREWDGEELTETADVDMRKSLLVQIYLNMAAAYINLHHYKLAEQVIDDGHDGAGISASGHREFRIGHRPILLLCAAAP
jgi:hypothetical protein